MRLCIALQIHIVCLSSVSHILRRGGVVAVAVARCFETVECIASSMGDRERFGDGVCDGVRVLALPLAVYIALPLFGIPTLWHTAVLVLLGFFFGSHIFLSLAIVRIFWLNRAATLYTTKTSCLFFLFLFLCCWGKCDGGEPLFWYFTSSHYGRVYAARVFYVCGVRLLGAVVVEWR